VLSASRAEQIERGLNEMAKRVLRSVPVNETWTTHQIDQDLRRAGSRADRDVILGCLGRLVKAGLIDEPGPGHFRRRKVRPPYITEVTKPSAQPQGDVIVPDATPHAAERASTLDQLAKVASELRAAAARLEEMARDIDDLAVEIVEAQEKTSADVVKLRQLQALLKNL